MATRLDLSGLSYLWDKIKAKFATKEVATTSDAGLMSAADKAKLDGIAAGAQVNSLTGVKGSAESSYRQGNVNLTPANLEVLRTGHLKSVNLDTILYNYIGTVWSVTGTGVSVFGTNCGTLICTDIDPFGTSGSRLQQIFMNFFGNDIWIRKRTDTTWSEWTCLRQNNGAVPVSAGGTGATTAAQARANLEITPANIGAVAKSGDTMTGGLTVRTTGGAVQLNAINNDFGLGVALLSASSGWHGIYSGGYYNGTQTIVDPKWIIARTSNGQPYMEIPLPVNSGGTGATTPAQARANLQITPVNIGAAISGYYGSTSNLDDLHTTGLYYVSNASATGFPQNNGKVYGGVINISNDDGTRTIQIVAGIFQTWIYYRRYINDEGGWSAWNQVTLT